MDDVPALLRVSKGALIGAKNGGDGVHGVDDQVRPGFEGVGVEASS